MTDSIDNLKNRYKTTGVQGQSVNSHDFELGGNRDMYIKQRAARQNVKYKNGVVFISGGIRKDSKKSDAIKIFMTKAEKDAPKEDKKN